MALARWNGVAQDNAGNILTTGTITVRDQLTNVVVTGVYADRDGTTLLGNPFNIGVSPFAADGHFYFHVANGLYKVTLSSGSFTKTWEYVEVGLVSTLREVLTGNRIYYVRKDGSDSNNGLADTSAGAFLTIARAMQVVTGIDAAGFTVTIQVRATGAPPTFYDETVEFPNVVGYTVAGQLKLLGDLATPANIVIRRTTPNVDAVRARGLNVVWDLDGFKFQSSGAGTNFGLYVFGSVVRIGTLDFADCTSGHMCAEDGGRIVGIPGSAGYNISGNSAHHLLLQKLSSIETFNRTITITGKRDITTFIRCFLGACVARVHTSQYGRPITADAATDVITLTAHGFSNGNPVQFTTDSGGTIPGGLAIETTYSVRDATANTFKVENTPGSGAINITSNGSGNRAFSVTGTRFVISDATCAIYALSGPGYLPGNAAGAGPNYI